MITMTKRWTFGTAILAAAIALCAHPLLAQSVTSVTGAGSAVLTSAASFDGVSLASLKFGMGVALAANGAASGDFQSTLHGTSANGKSQTIAVEGKPTTGSGNAGAPTTFSGTCTVNMGDGTPTQSGVPFTLTVVPSGGKGSLTLTLGATNLPAANVDAGSVTVQ